MEAIWRIGRSPDNEIVIKDKVAEEYHAVLKIQDEDTWIEDLGTRYGIIVNQNRVSKYRLKAGDTVQIGFTQIEWEDIARKFTERHTETAEAKPATEASSVTDTKKEEVPPLVAVRTEEEPLQNSGQNNQPEKVKVQREEKQAESKPISEFERYLLKEEEELKQLSTPAKQWKMSPYLLLILVLGGMMVLGWLIGFIS